MTDSSGLAVSHQVESVSDTVIGHKNSYSYLVNDSDPAIETIEVAKATSELKTSNQNDQSPKLINDVIPEFSEMAVSYHPSSQNKSPPLCNDKSKYPQDKENSKSDEDNRSTDDIILRQNSLRETRSVKSEFLLTCQRKRSFTVQDAREQASSRLLSELLKAQNELKLKDKECEKLLKVREQVESELEELTACLFEEANKMVQEALRKKYVAEKQLEEANEQNVVLQEELKAFKSLILTSTPQAPNRHLNPQIDASPTKKKESRPFWKSHRRSTSHHELTSQSQIESLPVSCDKAPKEIDHSSYTEFVSWRENISFDESFEFLSRVLNEDVFPCLNFANKQLSKTIHERIEANTIAIEPILTPVIQKCSLSDTITLCEYKIKLESELDWIPVCQYCRNRITAVCDFYTYVRYIIQGLVTIDDHAIYKEIVWLRRQMALARLGYL